MVEARRIAFVTPRFVGDGAVGGAETLIKALAERVAAGGRQVDFLTTCAKDHFTWKNVIEPGERKIGALDVHFFPVDEGRDVPLFHDIQTRICAGLPVSSDEENAWIENSVNSQGLCEHLRSNGCDYDRIVAGPYLYGLIYSACMIAPEKTLLVPCLHDEPFAYVDPMRRMFKSVRGLMCNVEPEMEFARGLYGLDSGKCRVVGMGIDAFEVNGEAFRSRHGIDGPYVMYSGRREELKGTPLLIDYVNAFRQRTGIDLKFVLTGSGQIDVPDRMKDSVIDLGFVTPEEMHEAMAGATAFVHACMYESLGIVLLESFLARTPALVFAKSRVLKWQCERSNGGLWFGNYPEFEALLQLLIEDDEVCRRLAASGREFVLREYSWSAVEQRLLSALDEL